MTIEASDNRAPLVGPRALGTEELIELPAGFFVVTLQAGERTRRLEFYAQPRAEILYDWSAATTVETHGVQWLDRSAAVAQADENLRALMSARKDAAAMDQILADQRARIERMEEGPDAHLARLLHATMAVQLRGPEDAWSVIEPIPEDSIAWGAYSERMLELRALFDGLSAAEARFAEVRTHVSDVGLQAALRAGDLLVQERAGADVTAAAAYAAKMRMDGAPKVGDPMPSFSLVDFDTGRAVRNVDFAGVPYLVELWSTWCKPCVADMPKLHSLHAEAGERLRIVSIAVGDSREPIVEFRGDRWPMPWTNVWAPGGAPVFEAWGVESVPFAVLVDEKGIVRAVGRNVELDHIWSALSPDEPSDSEP